MTGRSDRGFTLVEVTVTVAVTALLLLTVYGVVGGVSGAKKRLEGEGADYHRARVVFDRLARELRSAHLPGGKADLLFDGGDSGDGEAYLEFASSVTAPGQGRGGIVRIRYEVSEDPEEQGRLVLMRAETPLFALEQPEDAFRRMIPLAGLKLRFYGTDWQEEWSGARQQALPLMVEITLQVGEEGDIPFVSAVELPMAQEGR